MECSSSSLSFCTLQNPALFASILRKQQRPVIQLSAISYKKFIHFALDESKRHTRLVPSPLQVWNPWLFTIYGFCLIGLLCIVSFAVKIIFSFLEKLLSSGF
jgi:hypothetical protein